MQNLHIFKLVTITNIFTVVLAFESLQNISNFARKFSQLALNIITEIKHKLLYMILRWNINTETTIFLKIYFQVFASKYSQLGTPLSLLFWFVCASVIIGTGAVYPAKSAAHLSPPIFLLILATHTCMTLTRMQARVFAAVATLIPAVTVFVGQEWTAKSVSKLSYYKYSKLNGESTKFKIRVVPNGYPKKPDTKKFSISFLTINFLCWFANFQFL